MPINHARSESVTEGLRWRGMLLGLVGFVTLLRLVALAFNRTDIFVDESQYWLWGQNLDFGYYSKPPLIAWLIRGVTELAASDAPFWLRMPGAVLHGLTALILAALGARLFGARAGFWVGASYVTAPFTTVGSVLISTDTVMAPAYAAALYFYFRAAEGGRSGYAALAGVAVGLAFLAKYAAIYFLLGAALVALFAPAYRIGWRQWAALLAAFAVVIAPNIMWNLSHDLTTVSHTVDNVGWLRGARAGAVLHPDELASFFFNQFLVFGPVLFGALLMAALRPGQARVFVFFALPALVIVCVQALMSKAYANWAVATYFAGTLLAVTYLLARAPKLLPLSLMINTGLAVLLPVLAALAPVPEWQGKPLLSRYLGRADLSHQIIAAARSNGAGAVFAADRDILADLFYSGRDAGLRFYAPKPAGRAHNYYEQLYAMPAKLDVPVLHVLLTAPVCAGAAVDPVARFETAGGEYAGRDVAGYLLPEGCGDAAQ
ncbi:MAG: glycosyltransferase family 39 protein [Albidovulum sp.]